MLNKKNGGEKIIDRYKNIKYKKKHSYPEATINYEYQDEKNKYKMIWLHISSEPWNQSRTYFRVHIKVAYAEKQARLHAGERHLHVPDDYFQLYREA